MSSIVDRGISIYRQKGAFILLKKALQKLKREIYYRSISARGQYSLALGDQTVKFSAPTPTLVHRNRQRFKSESKELRDFLGAIRENDVVYDIGANTGLYSLFAATKCPEGTVVAFEPYPPNIKVLQQDITLNELNNVEVIKSALSNSVGEVEFSHPDDDDIGYGSSSIDADVVEGENTVPTTTGNFLVANSEIPSANIVKIDVEGAEPLVIDGLDKVLTKPSCRAVYCEVHLPGASKRPSIQDFGSSLEEIENRLEEFGFSVEQLRMEKNNEITVMGEK